MKLSDFDFELPEALIATRPARPRSAARLLVANGAGLADYHVRDLPDLLQPGDRLVLNDTRVIPARLSGRRQRVTPEGAAVDAGIEITLMAPTPEGTWRALAKPLRKLAPGDTLIFSDALRAEVVARHAAEAELRFACSGADFDAALAEAGAMPLPPYIAARRPPDARDHEDYQAIWARRPGAVAAPTASLHFDEGVMAGLAARGVGFSHVTLHVGAGTFLPVTADDVRDHLMHAEWGEVGAEAAAEINATRAAGKRVIPVGTTAMRLIESAAKDGAMQPWVGPTDIFITPGFRFQISDGLMTNFHLPKSTLMMLVSALMGVEMIRTIYAHAIAAEYRFFSYGDSSLLLPGR